MDNDPNILQQITSDDFNSFRKHILDAFSAHISIIDNDGTILETNDSWNRFCLENNGSLADCGIGVNYFEMLINSVEHGDDYALKVMLGLKSILKGARDRFEHTYPCHSLYEKRWFKLTAVPLGEEYSGLLLIHENTTISERRAQRLRETSERYQQHFENSLDGILITSPDGTILEANPAACNMLMYTKEELRKLGRDGIVIQDELLEKALQDREKLGRFKGELTFQRKNEEKFTAELTSNVFRGEKGELRTSIIFRDISKRIEAEKQVRKHQLMMEQLFKNAPVGIALVSPENDILDVNTSFENIFNYSKNEVIGLDIDTLLSTEESYKEAKNITGAALQGNIFQFKTLRYDKQGNEIPVLIGGVPVEMDGEIIAVYGIYADISEQHKYQQKIEQTLKEKETLLAEVHHRVKNNLAVINSMVELQLYESDDTILQQKLNETKNRILTIASIHEMLYQTGSFTHIPFHDFLNQLSLKTLNMYEVNDQHFILNFSYDELFLNINQAIPFALYLNELLGAFASLSRDEKRLEVNIEVRETTDNSVRLTVESPQMDNFLNYLEKNCSLNKTLLETLSKQLNGTSENNSVSRNRQQQFVMQFPKNNEKGSANALID